MSIAKELDEIIFGDMNEVFKEAGEDQNSLIFRDFDKYSALMDIVFEKVKNKPNLELLDEDVQVKYGISRDETVYKVNIRNKYYIATVAGRMYCLMGEWKWRSY